MNGGRIEQTGTPQELYHHPKTRVAGFICSPAMNFFPAQLEQNGGGLNVRVPDAIALPVPASHAPRYQSLLGNDMLLSLRPEHITEPRHNGRADASDFSITPDVVEPMGVETMVFFTVNGTEMCGRVDRRPPAMRARPCSCTPTWSTCT